MNAIPVKNSLSLFDGFRPSQPYLDCLYSEVVYPVYRGTQFDGTLDSIQTKNHKRYAQIHYEHQLRNTFYFLSQNFVFDRAPFLFVLQFVREHEDQISEEDMTRFFSKKYYYRHCLTKATKKYSSLSFSGPSSLLEEIIFHWNDWWNDPCAYHFIGNLLIFFHKQNVKSIFFFLNLLKKIDNSFIDDNRIKN